MREATALRRTGGDAVCCGGRAVGNIISENTKEEVRKVTTASGSGVEAHRVSRHSRALEGTCGCVIRALPRVRGRRRDTPRRARDVTPYSRAAFALSAVRVCPD